MGLQSEHQSPNELLNLSSSHDQQESMLLTDPEEEVALAYCFKKHKPAKDIQYDVRHILGTSKAHQQKEADTFLLKLKEVCNASDHMVGEVMDGCQGLLAHSLSTVKASVRDVLGSAG